MFDVGTKFCAMCKHWSGHDHAMTNDCKHPRVGEAAGMVLGQIKEGAVMDAYSCRMHSTMCSPAGNWFTPIERATSSRA